MIAVAVAAGSILRYGNRMDNTCRYKPDDFLDVTCQVIARHGASPSSNIVQVTDFHAI